MASVSSLTGSSSVSSLYGNRNILTGLASGMDTESMIENSVVGYKTKIQSLMQKQTRIQWEQDAYRSVIDKLNALSEKYMSYASKTNLSSYSFFNKSVTSTLGEFKDKVSAANRTSSNIQINGVRHLATAARYSFSAEETLAKKEAAIGKKIEWGKDVEVSKMAGTMSLRYGGDNNPSYISLNFGELETFKDADSLKAAIEKQLEGQRVTFTNGNSKSASEVIGVKVSGDGTISFSDLSKGNNKVYIESASDNIEKALGFASEEKVSSFKVEDFGQLSEKKTLSSYLGSKAVSVTVDGKTKAVRIGSLGGGTDPEKLNEALKKNLQDGIDRAFGEGKVTVGFSEEGGLTFSPTDKNVKVKVESTAGKVMGLGKGGVSNYVNTASTLEDLGVEAGKDGKYSITVNGVTFDKFTKDSTLSDVLGEINSSEEAGVKINYSSLTNKFTVTARETGAQSHIDITGGLAEKLFGADNINGNNLNKAENGDIVDGNGEPIIAGHHESYGDFYLRQEEDGRVYRISTTMKGVIIPNDDDPAADPWLSDAEARKQFADVFEKARLGYTAGTNAVVNITVDGENMTLTNASNTIDMDGMKVTLKGTFNDDLFTKTLENGSTVERSEEEIAAAAQAMETDQKVTFETKADADGIVDAVKSFVEEYNAAVKEIHDAYSTMPAEKNTTKHTRYDPLTEEQKADMTDKEIEAYEEKAKQGILFGDSNFSALYNKLFSAINPTGAERGDMRDVGITTTYADGVTTLTLDEDKLREMLDSNPEKVQAVFTKSRDTGSSSDGLVARLKSAVDMYASISTARPGILVSQAGTRLRSTTLLNNTMQKQINDLDKQIDKWTDRMSDKIDYYTRQFTALEQLMSQMNSQSSMLAGLMMGG